MRRMVLILLFLSLTLIGCTNENEVRTNYSNSSEEASWAYRFVKFNDVSYQITDKEVEKSLVGEKIGEVKRNIADMDVEENVVEVNFDTNELDVGTPLYKNKENDKTILYEINKKYYIAEKMN